MLYRFFIKKNGISIKFHAETMNLRIFQELTMPIFKFIQFEAL